LRPRPPVSIVESMLIEPYSRSSRRRGAGSGGGLHGGGSAADDDGDEELHDRHRHTLGPAASGSQRRSGAGGNHGHGHGHGRHSHYTGFRGYWVLDRARSEPPNGLLAVLGVSDMAQQAAERLDIAYTIDVDVDEGEYSFKHESQVRATGRPMSRRLFGAALRFMLSSANAMELPPCADPLLAQQCSPLCRHYPCCHRAPPCLPRPAGH
jgi:hypothetical protein